MKKFDSTMSADNFQNYSSPIENLTDDCLRLIFQRLPIFDRIRVERVCRRWHVLSKESWYTFKKLDLSPLTWGCTRKSRVTYVDNYIFEKVFQRCGQYLTTVDLSLGNYASFKKGLFQSLNVETIDLICKACPNLSGLNLTDVTIDQIKNNKQISRKLRHLFLQTCERKRQCEHANIRECERVFCLCAMANSNFNVFDKSFQEEEHMLLKSLLNCSQNLTRFGMRMLFLNETIKAMCVRLLKEMLKIKHLKLIEFPGNYLTYLSFNTIEELFLVNIDGIYPEHLCAVIEKFKSLKSFVLDTCRYIDDQCILKLLSQAESLKNLGLIGGSNSLSPEGMRYIPLFTHLEKLNIRGNSLVDDRILEALAVNCEQLIYLNISGCERVSNNGILSISTLPNLQHLIISQIPSVSDRFLGRFHNLKVLDCHYCPLIRDDGLCVLIERSSDLRILILEDCKLITEKLFDIAVETVESRSNHVVLNISISNNENFDFKQFNNATPFLRVAKRITHEGYFRMDFNDEYFPVYNENFVLYPFSNYD